MFDAAHAGGAAEHAIDLEHGGLPHAFGGLSAAFRERPQGAANAAGFVQGRRGAGRLLDGAALKGRPPRRVHESRSLEPAEIAVEGRQRVALLMARRLVGVDEVEPEPAGGERGSRAWHRAPNLHRVPLSNIHRVAVGSTNPVKLAAVRAVFQRLEPRTHVDGIAVASRVPDQPIGDAQTIEGATNRAHAARAALDADLGVGIEGGVVDAAGGMRTCAWAVVVTRTGEAHAGGSLSMPLPDAVAALIRRGVELGHAIDQLMGTSNIKHGAGAVGVLTEGLVNRQDAYETILSYALAPVLGHDTYSH